MRFGDRLSKGPLRVLAPIFYAIFVLSILLWLALLPLFYLYGMLLCPMVWIEWRKQGKDALVIFLNSKHSEEWMVRLSPMIAGRAVFLNWSERKQWDRWSLAAQLFEIFGPHGMPEQFTQHSLPAVIVFRELRRPKTFTFGNRSKNLEEKLVQLHAALALGRNPVSAL